MSTAPPQLRTWSKGPNFFVIGAQKAGTTRLCELLSRHPDVIIPGKEPWFFESEAAMSAKTDSYRALFDAAPLARARGEGSTTYSMCGVYPGTAQRIRAFDPEARIVYLVRHPLRRIESAWVQHLAVGEFKDPPLPHFRETLRGFEHTLMTTPLLLDPSLYWKQLQEYRRYFPDEQIRILFFEEFVADEGGVLASCLAFLDVDPSARIDITDDASRNARTEKRQRWPLVDAVRTLPGYERLKPLVPQFVKTLFTERLTRPAPSTVSWSPKALSWTVARIADDAAAFLAHTGKPHDYWSIP